MDTTLNTLATVAKWLIIIGIAWTVANTVLYFLSDPASASVDGSDPTAPSDRHPFNLASLEQAQLFGLADAAPAQSNPDETITETRLQLELTGVFVAEHPEDSAAIIAQKGKPGLLYEIDAVIPGNAKLVEVHGDHVILRRVGVREILRFPAAPDGIVKLPHDDEDEPAAESNPAKNLPPPQTAREFIERYQEKLSEDPTGTLSQLGVKPQPNNAGYRLDNLAESKYLSQTGLQPGDIIVSVNGRPVGNIQQDQLEIANVLAQGAARLEVQRGSRRFYVTASLQ